MKKKFYKIIVIFEKEDNGYGAFCPDLKSCKTNGPTLEAALENIQKVIKSYIKNMPPEDRVLLTAEHKTCSKGRYEIFTRFRKKFTDTFG